MNDLQRDKIQILLNDEVLMAVLSKVFVEAVESKCPKVGTLESNSLIGAKYRAYELSKGIIDRAFSILQSYTIERENKKPSDRAR